MNLPQASANQRYIVPLRGPNSNGSSALAPRQPSKQAVQLPQLESANIARPSSSELFFQGLQQTVDNLVDTTVGEGVRYLQGNNNSALSRNNFANSATQGLTNTAQQLLGHSTIDALNRVDIEAGVSSEGNLRFSLHTVQPLSDPLQLHHNTFFEGGIGRENVDSVGRTTVNLGLGYRYLTEDMKGLLGVNAFYDYEYPYNHRRLGIGLEAESSLWRAGLNHYLTLSDWKNSSAGWQEHALNGSDLTIAGRLPEHPEWELALTAYNWDQKEGLPDIEGIKTDLEYKPFDALSLNLGVDKQSQRDMSWLGGIKFNYQFGVPVEQQFKPVSTIALLDLKSRRFRSVERENFIRVQTRQNPNTIPVVTANTGNNTIGGRTAAVGSTVLFGQTIQIEDSDANTNQMTFQFPDGAQLEISDGSSVVIRDGVIYLNNGLMRYTSNGVDRTLSTPNATVTLHGTVVELFDDGTNSALQVTEGAATIAVSGSTLRLSANEAGCSSGGAPAACSTDDEIYDLMKEAVTALDQAIARPTVTLTLTDTLDSSGKIPADWGDQINGTAASRLIPKPPAGEKFEFTVTSSANTQLDIEVDSFKNNTDWIAEGADTGSWGKNTTGKLTVTTDNNGKAVVVVDLHLGGDYTVRVVEAGGSTVLASQVISLVDSNTTATSASIELTDTLEEINNTLASRLIPKPPAGEKFEFTVTSSANTQLDIEVDSFKNNTDWIAEGADTGSWGTNTTGKLTVTTDTNGESVVVVDLHDAGTYTINVMASGSNTPLDTQSVSLYGSVHDGHVYELIESGSDWDSAKSAAKEKGGYLAIINNQAENDFVFSLLASVTTTAADGGYAKYAWLGGNDQAIEGTFEWVDGSSIVSYDNWGTKGTREPDDYPITQYHSQNCLAMGAVDWPNGSASQWNDVDCSNRLAYVIEYE